MDNGGTVRWDDRDSLLYELQVHHAELQAQNDQLRKTQRALEEALQRSVPLSRCYILHDCRGRIFDSNPAAAAFLQGGGDLAGTLLSFVEAADLPVFTAHLRRVQTSQERAETKLRLRVKSRTITVRLQTSLAPTQEEISLFRTVITDPSRRQKPSAPLPDCEQRFRILASATTEGVAVCEKGIVLYCNDSFARLFGYGCDEVTGMPASALVAPEARESAIVLSVSCQDRPYESAGLRKDGSTFPAEFQGVTIGGTDLHVRLVRDLTAQKQAQETLRESEERFRKIFEEGPLGASISDLRSRIIKVNRRFCEMVGYTCDELLGRTFIEITHPEDRVESASKPQLLINGERSHYSIEKRYLHKRGHTVWASVTAWLINDHDAAPYVIATIEDISEKKKLQEQVLLAAKNQERVKSQKKIQKYQARLSQLASRLAFAQEDERRRIAIDIHDGIGQHLAFCKFKVAQMAKCPDQVSAEHLHDVLEILDLCISASRSLSFELSPAALFELGLEPALHWLAQIYASRHGLRIEVRGTVNCEISLPCRILLFQAAREFVANVAKHAGTESAEMSLSTVRKSVCITVRDWGAGFLLPTRRSLSLPTTGFGLLNIQEQLKNAGGTLLIESEPGKGTTATAKVPLRYPTRRRNQCPSR